MSKHDRSLEMMRLVGVVAVIGVLVLYFMWGDFVGISADKKDGDISVWVYDTDVVRGGTIAARARIDGGSRARIDSVDIGCDDRDRVRRIYGTGRGWGDQIYARDLDQGSDDFDFEIEVPDVDASTVRLHVVVNGSEAYAAGGSFSDAERGLRYDTVLTLHSATVSALLRVLRALICIGLLGATGVALVFGRRHYARKDAIAPRRWALALIPYTLVGYFVFCKQLAAATQLHGLLWNLLFLAAWFVAFAVADALMPRIGLREYTVTPAMISMSGGDAFRDADVTNPIKSALELEAAWLGAGMTVMRKKRHFIVARTGWRPVYVPVPASESFGDEPWLMRSDDRTSVMKVVEAATKLLGPLVCVDSRGGAPMRFG